MAKKKKTQLKPIARGFATTSLPKKIVPESLPQPSVEPETPVEDATQSTEADTGDKSEPSTSPAKEDLNAMSAEDTFLQSLVDKLQDKTEKEISRYR